MENRPPTRRQCTTGERLRDIQEGLQLLLGDSDAAEVEGPPRMELAGGAIATRWVIRAARIYSGGIRITMIIVIDNGATVRTSSPAFDTLTEAAPWIRAFMNHADLCKECLSIEQNHKCDSMLQYLLWGVGEWTLCSICQEDCLGITVTPCKHAFHKACLDKIHDNKCPNCRAQLREAAYESDS